jgi:hypothetical protein
MKIPELTHSRTFSLLLMLLMMWGGGCATTVPIDAARRDFNIGQLADADKSLAEIPRDQNAVMNLMERGMIRHLRRDYTNSTADWLEAVRLEKELETHSITKAGASMIVNDSTLAFRGYPYERTYLHVYLAKNFLARGLWNDAAVEARSIAYRLEKLDGFPDDAFSHYMAGFCLELGGDDSNAARQYREVARLMPACGIDPATGRFPPVNTATNRPFIPAPGQCELVCFLDFDGQSGLIPQSADLYANGKLLGTSRSLTTTAQLQSASATRMATRHAAKTLSRLALKWTLFIAASSRDENLGLLTGLLLLALESEDLRRWETLPAKLAVARVPCPPDLKEFEVVFRGFSGQTISRMTVTTPLHQKDRMFVSLCRNYP